MFTTAPASEQLGLGGMFFAHPQRPVFNFALTVFLPPFLRVCSLLWPSLLLSFVVFDVRMVIVVIRSEVNVGEGRGSQSSHLSQRTERDQNATRRTLEVSA